MQSALRKSKGPARATKEAYFVRVQVPDGAAAFFNATSSLGKPMPFEKPLATCAMQVKEDSVAFSLLHLTKKSAPIIAAAPVALPRGPLAKLTRRAVAYEELPAGELVVEMNEATYKLSMSRDDNGVVSLEQQPSEGNEDGSDVTFELPRQAVQLSLFMRSPVVNRILAVGFIGHLGKPGDGVETVARASAKVLHSLSQLPEFRILAGVETVVLPPAPSRWSSRPPVRKPDERAVGDIPVWLFSEADGVAPPALICSGHVVVEVDIDNANPSSGRLLCVYSPSEEIAEAFPHYRTTFDYRIAEKLRQLLGDDEIASITYDIVLGTVGTGTIERLREALAAIPGQDFTPTLVQDHL